MLTQFLTQDDHIMSEKLSEGERATDRVRIHRVLSHGETALLANALDLAVVPHQGKLKRAVRGHDRFAYERIVSHAQRRRLGSATSPLVPPLITVRSERSARFSYTVSYLERGEAPGVRDGYCSRVSQRDASSSYRGQRGARARREGGAV